MVNVDRVTLGMVDELSALVAEYMNDSYATKWGGSAGSLKQALERGHVSGFVARRGGVGVGFAATVPDFDLHHCVRGTRVVDLYVAPAHRGRAVALELLAHVANTALSHGFAYIRGEGDARRPAVHHLYGRFSMRYGDTYNVSGLALRRLASLRNLRPREVLARLPTVEMNHVA